MVVLVETATKPSRFCLRLTRCTIPCACHAKTTLSPKVVWACGVCRILTWKCVSCHKSVHFFNISTSKSGPNMFFSGRFLTWKCASRQTACTFSMSQLPKVVRNQQCLTFLTWKCALRLSGVHLISPLARWLRARRFGEPTFRPSTATNHWKKV